MQARGDTAGAKLFALKDPTGEFTQISAVNDRTGRPHVFPVVASMIYVTREYVTSAVSAGFIAAEMPEKVPQEARLALPADAEAKLEAAEANAKLAVAAEARAAAAEARVAELEAKLAAKK